MTSSKKLADPFGAQAALSIPGLGDVNYFRLHALEEQKFADLSRLPFTIRYLLESALRNCDGFAFLPEHVTALARWSAVETVRRETPFKPARVVLQDFTGVPAIVDLAAMREAMKSLGGDPRKINPLVRCDLVIDHSVQVDFFGRKDALALNEKLEFHRNRERYEFLKWGQSAFRNLRVVPPSTGIVHQVNLEYLSDGVYFNRDSLMVCPDSCVGTDSHTPMVNGLGVLAWGVGGIEAEAVMLDQPIYMLVPDVVGFRLRGELPEGATATDLVLRVTELCREIGVVEKFVEFFGPGLASMGVSDRATIGNMAPEQGSTVSFFPIDEVTLNYLRLTGRSTEMVQLTERYAKEQGLFRTENTPEPEFTQVVELDLSRIEPAVAGPKRPHDRIPLPQVGPTFNQTLTAAVGPKGFGLPQAAVAKQGTVHWEDGSTDVLHQGAVVIAAITSCTNTSNPSVMLGAGLVAKKAVERGLRVPRYVKTSLAPGSTVVTEYLQNSGLMPYLEELGFNLVNAAARRVLETPARFLRPWKKHLKKSDLVASAVLSGNRNFEGRVHALTRANYLASPPLVVAYALAGSTAMDITTDSLGVGSDGQPVYLRDIWPTTKEVRTTVESFVNAEMFREKYANVFKGSAAWEKIITSPSELYHWESASTYIQHPPFFEGLTLNTETIGSIAGAKVLGVFGDSVTTDHISPAGNIAKSSPAGDYLQSLGIAPEDFNSYGSRRGNHEVMMRGTFANIRIKNLLVPGKEGNLTLYHPTGEQLPFFDAAQRYAVQKVPLLILAGKEYGSGSSRDWAAKGPYLLGVRAVIAQSYERIHRSNLIGMGILPLEFLEGDSPATLKLDGTETFDIPITDNFLPGAVLEVFAAGKNGKTSFKAKNRVDTPVEVQYYRDGGILNTVLKSLAQQT